MSVGQTTPPDGAESHDWHTRRLVRRTAAVAAAFFLPHLRPGMRILDCGCGPGTITVGLAAAVAPGEVVGVDPLANRLDIARAAVAAQGIENCRFERGDIHALPFPDATFDGAFVHAVMEHVAEPVAALAEVRRVLKPGGVIGVRSPVHSKAVHWPSPDDVELFSSFVRRQKAAGGEDWDIARRLRELLRAAGFNRVVGSSSVETYGTAEETRLLAQELVQILSPVGNPMLEGAIENGFIDQAGVDRLRGMWLAWGDHPDAFHAAIWCEAIGWVDQRRPRS